jgi:type I restriction enzyme S subunit
VKGMTRMNDPKNRDNCTSILSEWKYSTIGESCYIITGGTPRTEIKEFYEPPEVPWIKSGEIRGNIIEKINTYISKKGLENSNARMLPRNTVVIALAGRGKTRGTTSILKIECACNQSVACIIPNKEKIEYSFLHYQLSYKYEYIRNITGDLDRSGLNLQLINRIPLLLPPLSEQRAIANILSRIQKIIEIQDKLVTVTKELKKSLMQKLFTDGLCGEELKNTEIGKIPKSWDITNIGSEFHVGTGGTPDRNKKKYFEGNIPWVTTRELNYCTIQKTNEYITESAIYNSNAKIFPKGTLLLAMYGLEAELTRGKCAILGISAACNQACAAITGEDRLFIRFLYYYYQNLGDKIIKYCGGTKQQNINIAILKSIKIPCPSKTEQKEIMNILQSIDVRVNILNEHQDRLQELFKSMLNVLMTGKVRVKDLEVPADAFD